MNAQTAPTDQTALIQRLQEALAFQKNRQFLKAETSYKSCIHDFPDALEPKIMLGFLYYQQRQPEKVINLLKKALPANKENFQIKKLLIQSYLDIRDIAQADKILATFLPADLNNSDAYSLHGYAMYKKGRLDDAIAFYKKSLDIKPNTEAYNKLGEIYLATKRRPLAQAILEEAFSKRLGNNDTRLRLCTALLGHGHEEQIHKDLLRVLTEEPDNEMAIHLYTMFYSTTDFFLPSIEQKKLLNQLLLIPNISHGFLYSPWRKYVSNELLNKDIESILEATDYQSFCLHPKREGWLDYIRTPYFINGLSTLHIRTVRFEFALTYTRRWLMDLFLSSPSELAPHLDYILAQAMNMELNEFVFFVSDDETHALDHLRKTAADMASQPLDKEKMAVLGLLACYEELYKTLAFHTLTESKDAPEQWNTLIKLHITNRKRETEIKKNLKSLSPIVDTVSRAVQEQYEESPYPRWRSTTFVSPFHMNEIMPGQNNDLRERSILIAGCGTGQHIQTVVRDNPFSDITAIDLSRSSLAYAQRQLSEIGCEHVQLYHGDILDVGRLNKTFDHIECAGVLHHMADPMAGWRALNAVLRTGGTMKIGLYSEIARHSIIAARQYIEDKGYGEDAASIRACRNDILRMDESSPARGSITLSDFYSLSMCRDLIFHRQEHRFTLPQLKSCLEELNLGFLFFIFRTTKPFDIYAEKWPEDKTKQDLDRWDIIEHEYPDTFIGMYQFCCVKK